MSSTRFDPKHLKGGDTPWVPFTPYNEKVGIKLLHVDPFPRRNGAADAGAGRDLSRRAQSPRPRGPLHDQGRLALHGA